jgi:hypothetical protein
MTTTTCESCGMPLLEAADHARSELDNPLCRHCTDESGQLRPFDERFERMTQWAMRREGLERPAAEARTRDYMRGMPAWRDHPALRDA